MTLTQGAVPQWRDISTAPTNESILVHIPGAEHYGPGIYRAIWVDMGSCRRWHTSALSCGRDCGDRKPDAWMPLPPPPEQP